MTVPSANRTILVLLLAILAICAAPHYVSGGGNAPARSSLVRFPLQSNSVMTGKDRVVSCLGPMPFVELYTSTLHLTMLIRTSDASSATAPLDVLVLDRSTFQPGPRRQNVFPLTHNRDCWLQ